MGEGAWGEVDLVGRAFLDAVSALLLEARAEDPMAGLWEAGDVQWWWKDEGARASSRATCWLDAGGSPVACLLVAEEVARSDEPGRIEADLVWRPSRDGAVRARVLPTAVDRLVGLGRGGKVVSTYAHEGDGDLRGRLEAAGFRREPAGDMVQLWLGPGVPPDPVPLPDGMRFDDDRSRPADRPHHLAKRNGERVAERLGECSLYRRDLDLCVRTVAGEVAAYCLCWLDPGNGVGLFEPVRTEEAYQRRGIGRALMIEGIRRLMVAGATLVKVTSAASNDAAKALYRGVGFAPAFGKLCYTLCPNAERSGR